MTSKQTTNAIDDLKDYAEKLLYFPDPSNDDAEMIPQNKPKVFWSIYFNMTDTSHENLHSSPMKNVYLCSGPDIELDFDHAVNEVRNNINYIVQCCNCFYIINRCVRYFLKYAKEQSFFPGLRTLMK